MLQVHFQIGVNLSILINFSSLYPNFKNIQIRGRANYSLLPLLILKTSKQGGGEPFPSTLLSTTLLYPPPSLNFQTGRKE